MHQQISPRVAIAVVAIGLVLIFALGTLWYRSASGESAAAAMHATMSKIPAGKAPFTKEQMDEMNKRAGRRNP